VLLVLGADRTRRRVRPPQNKQHYEVRSVVHMSVNIARLTIFSIISAIEQDGRALISTNLSRAEAEAASTAEMIQKAKERARKDQSFVEGFEASQ